MNSKLKLIEYILQLDDNSADNLEQFLIQEDDGYLEDVIGKDRYNEFINDLVDNIRDGLKIKCSLCNEQIDGEIYCDECLQDKE